jgi:hypothetical protein
MDNEPSGRTIRAGGGAKSEVRNPKSEGSSKSEARRPAADAVAGSGGGSAVGASPAIKAWLSEFATAWAGVAAADERAVVEILFADAGEESATGVGVHAVEGLDEHLDGAAGAAWCLRPAPVGQAFQPAG